MFCKSCGKEIPEGAKFCSGCGTPVEPAQGAPEDQKGTNTVENAAPVYEHAPESGGSGAAAGVAAAGAAVAGGVGALKHRGKSGLIVLGVAAVVVIAVIVLLVRLVGGLFGGGSRTQAFAYLNDDYELMYLSDLKEGTEALEITDEAYSDANVQFSPDGKTLYFRDNSQTLYTIPVSELKDNGRPERIARDVTSFRVLDNGKVLYTEYDGESELSLYDGKESFRLAKDYDGYQISEDEKTLYYTEADEDDGTLTLYRMPMTKDGQEEELLDKATSIYTAYDADVLVYGEDDYDPNAAYDEDSYDPNSLTVYSCKPGEEPTELVSDVYSIVNVEVDGSKVSFYYYIQETEERTLYDFVTDSTASQDAALVAEELTSPSWYGGYYPDEVYFDGTSWFYTDYNEETYAIDSAQIQEMYPETPMAELDEWDVEDVAYEAARARYEEAYAAYEEQYDDWRAARSRENIRESLKETSYDQTSLSLYHYTGSAEGTPIATDITPNSRVSSQGVFLYQKNSSEGGTVADVADLDYYGEVYDLLDTGSGDSVWYQNVGGTESTIEFDDEETHVNRIYVLNDKEVVLEITEGEQPSLLSYDLGGSALTFKSTILDDDYSGLTRATDAKDNDVLYLFTDVDDEGFGDFNCYSGGELTVVAKEVGGVFILDESGTTYVVTDMDNNGNIELARLDGEKLTTISDEISDSYGACVFLDDKQILYISDSDLYLWDGKEERRVARDVEHVWAAVEEPYTSYSAGW